MTYFPQSLLKTFPNLIAVYINDGNLQEIHQSDLEPFTALRLLDLFGNRLEVIEPDLFKFNPKLEVIWLSNNQIRKIDPKVFDHLENLSFLYLMDNVCIEQSETNRTEVIKLIQNVKAKCSGSTPITTTTTQRPHFPIWTRRDPFMSEISELQIKFKKCEEELGQAHRLMEAMNFMTEIQLLELREESSGLRMQRNILWFFVAALGVVVIGLGLLLYRNRAFVGSVRYVSWGDILLKSLFNIFLIIL